MQDEFRFDRPSRTCKADQKMDRAADQRQDRLQEEKTRQQIQMEQVASGLICNLFIYNQMN
jgi:hypothetical protein